MNYTKRKDGLLVPNKGHVVGVYHAKLMRAGKLIDEWDFDNIIVAEGLIAMLNIMFAGQSVISNWYMGVFQNNYTPVSTDTAASITGNAGEFTSYSGGARPTFSAVAATQPTPSVSNSVTQANFTFTGSATLAGAFLVSNATPGASSGTLYSAAQFSSSKQVGPGDQLALGYTTTLAAS